MASSDDKLIRIWYWSGAGMVFLVLIIGGITRLTQSGLSMVEWNPIMGIIPPLTDLQWEETFARYREFPEYQQRNRGMDLSEFQFIFFWEYLHRMAARFVGLVFIIPFGYFLARRKLSVRQLKRASLLLVLGLLQGLMGWFMVVSGLVDVPYVSPYRLAVHLLLAFAIFGCCVWFALDLRSGEAELHIVEPADPTGPDQAGARESSGQHDQPGSVNRQRAGQSVQDISSFGAATRILQKPAFNLRGWLLLFITILILQIVWGAFVAGLNAGQIYNTFPKMNDSWVPLHFWLTEPFFRNLIAHPAGVQWVHRLLATLIGVMAVAIWVRLRYTNTGYPLEGWGLALLGIVSIQYLIGVYTLLHHVPVALGVIHQAVAMVLFGVAICFCHKLKSITKS